jgi:kumamolisin
MALRLSATIPTILAGACLWAGAAAGAPQNADAALPHGFPGFSGSTAGVVTPGHHRAQATRLRPVHPSRRVSVSIGVRHDGKGLLARISGTRVKSAPLREIVRRHGATDADIQAIVRWARAEGLTARVGKLRTRVIVSGPASRMSRAFGVPLHHYRARNGRTYVAAPKAIPVPPAIAGVATGIAGLSHVPPPVRVTPTPKPPQGSPAAPATPTCANTPSIDLSAYGLGTPMTPFGMAQAYGFDAIGTGSSYPAQTIAILEIDQSYDPPDLAQIQQKCRFGAGSAPVRVRAINLAGAQTQIGTGNNGEANLDTQLVAALAPAGTTVVVINVAGDAATPFSDFFEQAAALPNLTVISMSYGGSEMAQEMGELTSPQDFTQADTLAQALVASGVSMFASSGDQGSMGPPANVCASNFPAYGLPGYASVNWPASAPGVTAVGGTMWSATTRTVPGEQVWNENGTVTGLPWPCVVAGGGGGQSVIFPRPAWQKTAGAAVRGLGRLVPDVSMLAGQPGYLTSTAGNTTTSEGTSASAPLLASAVLRINAERLAAGRKPVGYLNPLLYGPLATGVQDITVGNNDIFGTGVCCTAGPGYDMASGLGAPNIGAWPALIP